MACGEHKLIYTVGTSTRSIDEFIELLRNHSIDVVVDVRKFPGSKFEWFCGERLAELLNRASIDYVSMGVQLGGYRRGGYEAYTNTEAFRVGLKWLEEIAEKNRVAVVCAERLPWRCHRRFICFELEKKGWQVVHIIEQGRYWQPAKDTKSK